MKSAERNHLSKDKLNTPTDLGQNAVKDIEAALNGVLADSFALYFKTKNFHWHASGPHFRDYHLLFDEQAGQITDTTDALAERVRKIGGRTLRSINQIATMTRVAANDADFVEPADMLAELMDDIKAHVISLRATRTVCETHGDSATASLIDGWIDEAERRVWFLYESLRPQMTSGH